MTKHVLKKRKDQKLDLLPIMALFSILIPFLISVVVFQRIGLVDTHFPLENENNPNPPDLPEQLNLSVAITDEGLKIVSKNGMMPTIFTQERWTIQCDGEEESREVIVKDGRRTLDALRCADGRAVEETEIDSIKLITLHRTSEEDEGIALTALVDTKGQVLLNKEGKIVTELAQLQKNPTVFGLRDEKPHTFKGEQSKTLKVAPRSAYADLMLELKRINNRFADVEDIDRLTVIADDDIAFDKVIQVMDAARQSGFSKVSLGKLAG